jgi:hypothetical protein
VSKKPVSQNRLRRAILRSVASSTAIETRQSIRVIEKRLREKTDRPAASRRAG